MMYIDSTLSKNFNNWFTEAGPNRLELINLDCTYQRTGMWEGLPTNGSKSTFWLSSAT